MSSDGELALSIYDFAKILRLVHHADFRETLNVQALIPLLGKYNLLTEEERQEIMQFKRTDCEKIDHLVHILPRKGKYAYQQFIKCLESEKEHLSHPELAQELKKTAEKLKAQQLQPFQLDTDSKTAVERHTQVICSCTHTHDVYKGHMFAV